MKYTAYIVVTARETDDVSWAIGKVFFAYIYTYWCKKEVRTAVFIPMICLVFYISFLGSKRCCCLDPRAQDALHLEPRVFYLVFML